MAGGSGFVYLVVGMILKNSLEIWIYWQLKEEMTDIDMKIVPVVHPSRPASHTVAPESSALSDLFDNYSHPIVAI